jgi:protein-tyrosine phosphatase
MKTEVLKIDSLKPDVGLLDHAAGIVASGGVVGFPTETVYGLAVNADDETTMARLLELKGGRQDKPFTRLIAEVKDIRNHVPDPPESCVRLAEKYWPGPLTIVFPAGEAGIGIRVPAHQVARELVRMAGVNVVAPSANPSDLPPATNAEAVLSYFDGRIELVLDSGETRLKEASTVVVFKNDVQWQVVREGLISADMIAKTVCKTVLFVCTGNSCRSPVAEHLCRRQLAQVIGVEEAKLAQNGFRVISAGTVALSGSKASIEAVEAMAGRGYDLTQHRTQVVTPEMVDAAFKVYVMSRHHCDSIVSLMPNVENKVQLLDAGGSDVEDPVGGSMDEYNKCIDAMERLIRDKVVPELLGCSDRAL